VRLLYIFLFNIIFYNMATRTQNLSELQLPTDSTLMGTAVQNLFAGLNKANQKGVFELNEAYQLRHDLQLVIDVFSQVHRLGYTQPPPQEQTTPVPQEQTTPAPPASPSSQSSQ